MMYPWKGKREIYHSTTLENAIKILKTRKIWMTNAASPEFNIKDEIYPLILSLNEARNKIEKRKTIDRVIEKINDTNKMSYKNINNVNNGVRS